MNLFLSTPEFKALRIGFVLDEGMCNEDEFLGVYYTERISVCKLFSESISRYKTIF